MTQQTLPDTQKTTTQAIVNQAVVWVNKERQKHPGLPSLWMTGTVQTKP